MKPITPNLWFDTKEDLKAAVDLYVSVFPNSKITNTVTMHQTPTPGGDTMVISFELNGQPFTAINGGPLFKFTEALSLAIRCETQEEIDYYWEKLSADPKAEQCGWCKDKWGVSWQVTPTFLNEVMASGDQAKISRVTQCFLPMKKIDLAVLEKAAEGK